MPCLVYNQGDYMCTTFVARCPEGLYGEPIPLHGQVRHSHLSARVPDAVGRGVFANGVMILTGAYEIVLDFVLRFGEPNRIVARVVLPHVVARQLIAVVAFPLVLVVFFRAFTRDWRKTLALSVLTYLVSRVLPVSAVTTPLVSMRVIA